MTALPSIPVVFQHTDFIVINKPSGVSVHDKNEELGIVSLLKRQLSTTELFSEKLNSPDLWLVHRLDKVTSGCLLLAKNADAASQLGIEFQNRRVQKYYLALCDKKPKKRQGSVIGDLKKVRDGKWILARTNTNPSVTHFFDKGFEDGLRLQILKPYTGQTHQLRVVMNSLGATILGDEHYGGSSADRTYLHAWQLQFTFNSQRFYIQCLPEQGRHFLQAEFTALAESINPPGEYFSWPDAKLIPKAQKREEDNKSVKDACRQ